MKNKDLSDSLTSLNSKLSDYCIVKRYYPINQGTVSLPHNGFVIKFAPTVLSGYKMIGVVQYSTGHDCCVVANAEPSTLVGRNTLDVSYAVPNEAFVDVLYVKL